MSEIVAPALHAPDADDLGVVRAIDRISASAGFIASVALAIMTIVVCYDVISRYIFNAPTTWVTEVSTYLFVAVVFLGLAEAQRANAHIQVEILVDRLGRQQRAFIELVGLWLGVLFATIAAWHCARFTFLEYLHDARDWGLLGTPQWLPQVPLTIGYGLFVAALLRDIFSCVRRAASVAQWVILAVALGVVATPVLARARRRENPRHALRLGHDHDLRGHRRLHARLERQPRHPRGGCAHGSAERAVLFRARLLAALDRVAAWRHLVPPARDGRSGRLLDGRDRHARALLPAPAAPSCRCSRIAPGPASTRSR